MNNLRIESSPCLCRCHGCIALGSLSDPSSALCLSVLSRSSSAHPCCWQTNASRGSIKRHCHFACDTRAYRVLELQKNHADALRKILRNRQNSCFKFCIDTCLSSFFPAFNSSPCRHQVSLFSSKAELYFV